MIRNNKNTNSSHLADVIVRRLSTYRSVYSQLHSKKEVGAFLLESGRRLLRSHRCPHVAPATQTPWMLAERQSGAHAAKVLYASLCKRHASAVVAAGLMLWCLTCRRAQHAESPMHFSMWLLIYFLCVLKPCCWYQFYSNKDDTLLRSDVYYLVKM